MQRSPYLIVKEFCDSKDEQLRRNAATALAAIADRESLDELVSMGLNEASPDVRERIEREIAQLPPEARAGVVRNLAGKLKQPGLESRKAYHLLGELRSHGVEAPLPGLTIFRRLKLAKSLHDVVYPSRKKLDRTRGAGLSLFGAAVAATVTGFIQMVAFQQGGARLSDLYGFLFLSAFVAIALAVISLQISSPLALHADRGAIATLDLLTVAGASLPIAAIVVALVVSSEGGTRVALASALMVPVLAISTRLAMLATLRPFRVRGLNLWAGILSGTGAGTLAMSLVPALFGLANNPQISNLWLTLVPVAAGLAAAWAQQDASAAGEFRLPAAIRIAGAAPAAILCAIVVIVAFPRGARRDEFQPVTIANSETSAFGPFAIHALPATIPLEVSVPVQVGATLVSEMEPASWSISPIGLEFGATGKLATFRGRNLNAGNQNLVVTCPACEVPSLLGLVYLKLDLFFDSAAPVPVLASVTLQSGPPLLLPMPFIPKPSAAAPESRTAPAPKTGPASKAAPAPPKK